MKLATFFKNFYYMSVIQVFSLSFSKVTYDRRSLGLKLEIRYEKTAQPEITKEA